MPTWSTTFDSASNAIVLDDALLCENLRRVGGQETIDYEESEDVTGGVLAPVC